VCLCVCVRVCMCLCVCVCVCVCVCMHNVCAMSNRSLFTQVSPISASQMSESLFLRQQTCNRDRHGAETDAGLLSFLFYMLFYIPFHVLFYKNRHGTETAMEQSLCCRVASLLQRRTAYRVAKTHRMPYIYRSFSSKEP